jgi:hypothetical protein
LLSFNSLKDDGLALLDTFFNVVVWSGKTITQWKKANYHEQPEYENLRQLMEVCARRKGEGDTGERVKMLTGEEGVGGGKEEGGGKEGRREGGKEGGGR